MNWPFLYKGLILGFSVAAPVGPIGVLCINRTLNKSYVAGLVTGLGAASADLIYGLIAAFGVTIVSEFLISQKLWIQAIGLVFLFYLGIKTLLKKKPTDQISHPLNNALIKDYLTTFVLTITNPMTILFFITVFASLGLQNFTFEKISATSLVIGVFTGSVIWWLILSAITYKLKNRLSTSILKLIDLLSGCLIIIFGLLVAYNLTEKYLG